MASISRELRLLRRTMPASLMAIVALSAGLASPAAAADLGDSCCADLEERIAELEATTARKGNRKVSLKVSGQVHRVLTFWDDGHERNVYESDTSTWSSRFRFSGAARINDEWDAGYRIEIAPADGLSTNLNQLDDDGFRGGLRLARNYYYINNKRLGRISVGLLHEGNDGATGGGDFSGSDSQSGSGVGDMNGGFFLRRAGVGGAAGLVSELTWADVTIESPGDGASERNIVRYDSPTFEGFKLAWSWGEDDDWTVGLFFEKEIGDFEVGASVGYGNYRSPVSECRQRSAIRSAKECTAVGGSLGFRHVPTGLHANYSTGYLDDDLPTPAPLRFGDEQTWHYTKAGIYRQFFSLGHSGLFGEYYRGSKAIEELYAAGTSSFAPGATFLRGSMVEFYGIGAFQDIDAASAQIYLSYRNFDVDLDVIDPVAGTNIDAALERFQAIVMGMRLEF